MKSEQCPTDQQLSDFDLGSLDSEKYAEVSSHLDACPDCGARFESLPSRDDGLLEHLRVDLPAEVLRDDSEMARLVAAAAALQDTSATGPTETFDSSRTRAKPSVDQLVAQILLAPQDYESSAGARADADVHRDFIGRYKVTRILGEGGFGRVYLAHDDELVRSVAIKVPRRERLTKLTDVEQYLAEARTLASLDHPHIVPVHDVGRTDDGLLFVVSKYIQGSDLAARIKQDRPSNPESAELVATVAETLHYAHTQGWVHRDIKPANVLLDAAGRPFVADFGLALKEADLGKGSGWAGTLDYMSPEQARGEGHRIDRRSDIFSLGIVFYELLTGRRPFRGDSATATLNQISTVEARPPRHVDDRIPKELERICLIAVSKRATDRYTTAQDMADDLRYFLRKTVADTTALLLQPIAPAAEAADDADSKPIKIIPKGLRSFDEHDADFFLELLPGPRDRDGLPDSIRFWKTRIEENDADKTFSVGLIYGPSGCGKSSLVKAGLLPRLSDHVITLYVEATSEETETRLLNGLQKRFPGLENNLNLNETLATLRRGNGIPTGKKVLIVLDQFEQWLHAKKGDENTELVQALRQCDGGRVQCIVMVRDDFWMAVTRLLQELEVRLLEDHNLAAVDLFSERHAHNVLAAFGRSFGNLPDDIGQTTKEQRDFLQQSTAGLAEEGKVICVRLALFAEMTKGKAWTPATLKEVGGTAGVGVTFLEEMFSSSTASPVHRYHQKAARAVLKALLPESGTNIKGQMKSHDELFEASGYAGHPRDFDDLVRILDSEIRLITPTDPEGVDSDDSASHAETGQKYYQLTHDYLVHSLRDWLTRKQKETRRGRAELRLTERSVLWSAKPDNRHLPTWWEYLNIRFFTNNKAWSEPQQKMMQRAARIHGVRGFAGLLVLTVALVAGLLINRDITQTRNRDRADALVTNLKKAEIEKIPEIVREIDSFREVVGAYLDEHLREEHQKAAEESPEKLRTAMALLPADVNQIPVLRDCLLDCSMNEFGVIRDSLQPHRNDLSEQLWNVFRNDSTENKRFRAGLALARYVPNDEQWTDEDATFLVDTLLGHDSEEQQQIRSYLTEIKTRLYVDLERAFRDLSAKERQEIGSAKALAQFAGDDIGRIADLAAQATSGQYAVLYPLLASSTDQSGLVRLRAIVMQHPEDELSQTERVTLGRRRAGAAVTLLRKGDREQFFEVFRVTDDPESLTQFVHRCRERGVTATELLACLHRAEALRQTKSGESRKLDDRVLFGLLLAMGEFDATDIPSPKQEELVSQLVDWYANDPSSTVHGASGWLLRHWGYDAEAEKIDQTEVPYAPEREWFIRKIDADTPGSTNGETATKSFYFTFVVFDKGEYRIGTPADEAYWGVSDFPKQRIRLTRRFAVLDREITREEFEAFGGTIPPIDEWSPPPGKHPVVKVCWYDCVTFCRALTTRAGLPEEDQCYPDPTTLAKDVPRELEPNYNQYPRNWEVGLDRSGFRLPTEAEWEVMCRAQTDSRYYFGSDPSLLDRYGSFYDNSANQPRLPRSLRPNLRGLFDTHGNVKEWVNDWYSPSRTVNPDGPPAGFTRILRGGGYRSSAPNCRSAYQYNDRPTNQTTNDGFRIVLDVVVPSLP